MADEIREKLAAHRELFPLSDICPHCWTGHLDTPCSAPCVCRCRSCDGRMNHRRHLSPAVEKEDGNGE